MITTATRAYLMAARDDVFRAGDGHANVDLALVAVHIVRALRSLCPHLPVTWKTQPDENGRSLTICYACGMSWYNHELDIQEAKDTAARQQAAYMSSLEKRIQDWTLAHGFAYVTSLEGERLRAYGLHQPGHTIHRFSTSSEDRSDATQGTLIGEAVFEDEGAPARKLLEDLAA